MAQEQTLPVRERLILAGIGELNHNGVSNFSVRRVAEECGLSCAAPYKHFQDKNEFVAAIIEYVNQRWEARLSAVVERCPGDYRRQLVEVSLEYIRFLVENPYFRSIIMLKNDRFDDRYQALRGRMTAASRRIVDLYCAQVNMPPEVQVRKLFVIRSLIYGAALMFDNGELDYTEENMRFVAYNMEREFDLA